MPEGVESPVSDFEPGAQSAGRGPAPFLLGRLSDKDREVLDLLVVPNSNKEIARHLDLSQTTVEKRLRGVRDKLKSRDRNDTARIYKALTLGLGKTAGGFSDLSGYGTGVEARFQAKDEPGKFQLHDVAAFERFAPWEPSPSRSTGLEDLLDRTGAGNRLALALGIAIGLAFLALAGFAIVWAIYASDLQRLVT